jgi:hypothetical protein
VPRLARPSPLLAGGGGAAAGGVAWGRGALSAAPPRFRLVNVSADGGSVELTLSAGGGGAPHEPAFVCTFSYSTLKNASSNASVRETFALVAVNGSWISSRAGGLPARGCAFYRVPASSLAAAKGCDSQSCAIVNPVRTRLATACCLPCHSGVALTEMVVNEMNPPARGRARTLAGWHDHTTATRL